MTFPIGLALLASILKQKGHTVSTIELPYHSVDEAVHLIKLQCPDVVGASCWTGTHLLLTTLAEQVKKSRPETRFVFGGHHATMFWNQLLVNYPQLDAVIIGEGEESFPALLEAWESGTVCEAAGVAFRGSDGIQHTGPPQRLLNIDHYPFPDYESFRLARDTGSEVRYGAVKRNGKEYRTHLLASRGCPFKCTFCADTAFYNRPVSRDPKLVADEIELLNVEYGVGLFEFTDMTFALAPKRTEALCQEILDRELNISWQAMSRASAVSASLLQLMKEAGCYSIAYGVETGSPELLQRIKKGVSRSEIVEAFKTTQSVGLSTLMLLMVGNPGESESTIRDTVDLIYETRPTQIDPCIYQVYPESQTYKTLKADGYIDDDYWLTHDVAPYYDGEHSAAKLFRWQQKITFHHNTYPRDRLKRLGTWLRSFGRIPAGTSA